MSVSHSQRHRQWPLPSLLLLLHGPSCQQPLSVGPVLACCDHCSKQHRPHRDCDPKVNPLRCQKVTVKTQHHEACGQVQQGEQGLGLTIEGLKSNPCPPNDPNTRHDLQEHCEPTSAPLEGPDRSTWASKDRRPSFPPPPKPFAVAQTLQCRGDPFFSLPPSQMRPAPFLGPGLFGVPC